MENEEIIDLDCSVNMMWKFGRLYIDFDLNGFFQRVIKFDIVVVNICLVLQFIVYSNGRSYRFIRWREFLRIKLVVENRGINCFKLYRYYYYLYM